MNLPQWMLILMEDWHDWRIVGLRVFKGGFDLRVLCFCLRRDCDEDV